IKPAAAGVKAVPGTHFARVPECVNLTTPRHAEGGVMPPPEANIPRRCKLSTRSAPAHVLRKVCRSGAQSRREDARMRSAVSTTLEWRDDLLPENIELPQILACHVQERAHGENAGLADAALEVIELDELLLRSLADVDLEAVLPHQQHAFCP